MKSFDAVGSLALFIIILRAVSAKPNNDLKLNELDFRRDVASRKMTLNGNTFLIVNKKYPHAKLVMWNIPSDKIGEHRQAIGTFEPEVFPDQFWQLKEDENHPGYYYIYNVKHDRYRLTMFSTKKFDVGTFNNQFFDDQLWRLDKVSNDYYRIYNMKYSNSRLTKFGKGDRGELGTYHGDYFFDDQEWKLVPRYKADVKEIIIWSCDNRQGEKDFSETITVTTGIKLTNSQSVSMKTGLELSLRASISFAGVEAGMETKLSREITKSLSQSEEETWSRTSVIKFTAPAGKKYRVKQVSADFASPLASDDCFLTCDYTVEETDKEFNQC